MTGGLDDAVVSERGQLHVVLRDCAARTVRVERTFPDTEGPSRVSFDWEVAATGEPHQVDWTIRQGKRESTSPVDPVFVDGAGPAAPAGERSQSGSLSLFVDTEKPVTLSFRMRAPKDCSLDGRTTLRLDDVTVEPVQTN